MSREHNNKRSEGYLVVGTVRRAGNIMNDDDEDNDFDDDAQLMLFSQVVCTLYTIL